jgi:hypothetical protein
MNTKKNTWPVSPAGKGFQVMLPTGSEQTLEAHYVDPDVTTCSCHRGARCPALREVQGYRSAEPSSRDFAELSRRGAQAEGRSRRSLAAGGTAAKQAGGHGHLPDSCPVCGAAVLPDRFGKRGGWRCEQGGLVHFYQARYGHLRTWFTRPAGERMIVPATQQERAAMGLTYPAGA